MDVAAADAKTYMGQCAVVDGWNSAGMQFISYHAAAMANTGREAFFGILP